MLKQLRQIWKKMAIIKIYLADGLMTKMEEIMQNDFYF